MPGQAGVFGELAQRAADPAGGPPQACKLGELTVGDDFAIGHLHQGRVQGRSSKLGRRWRCTVR